MALTQSAAREQAATAGTAAASRAEDQRARPRVRFVATGGTISNRAGGRLTATDLLAMIPELERYATVDSEQFSNVASSELTLEQYVQLARRLNEIFRADSGLAGIVVTMGTDTMEELAYFLHLTVRDDRPVVVVGAMRNPSQIGFEGHANLLEGIRVAADPAARGIGTVVVLNDEINSAREVVKTDARRLQTFRSGDYGILGVVDTDRVAWYRRPVKRCGTASEFDVFAIGQLPRVDIVLTYQGAPGDLIKAAVDLGAKGLVLAGAGAGGWSGTQGEGLAYAGGKGVVAVTTSRAGSGRIWPFWPSPAGSPGNELLPALERGVAGEDLPSLKSRILLMLALATTADRAEIQRMFTEYERRRRTHGCCWRARVGTVALVIAVSARTTRRRSARREPAPVGIRCAPLTASRSSRGSRHGRLGLVPRAPVLSYGNRVPGGRMNEPDIWTDWHWN